MDRHLRALPILLLAFALLRCSEPSGPVAPPPRLEPPADSTSHAYTWEYFVIGKFGSTLVAVAADSDTNVWAVGDVDMGYEIPATPSGRMRLRANAFHINPRGIQPYAIELDDRGFISSYALLGVSMHAGFPTFWSGLSRTKITADSVNFRFFGELNGLSLGQHYYQAGSDGHVYEFGGSGFLARFIGPKHERFEQIPTGTAKTLKSFAQAGPNEFYIGGWTTDSVGGIFHHLKDGQVRKITRQITEGITLRQAMAIWASEKRLFAHCPPFIFIQSLSNSDEWDAIHIPLALDVERYGSLVCAAGRADNDVFFAGHFGNLLHYNGRSLHVYKEVQMHFPDDAVFYSMVLTPRHAFIVGNVGGYAILVKGTKATR